MKVHINNADLALGRAKKMVRQVFVPGNGSSDLCSPGICLFSLPAPILSCHASLSFLHLTIPSYPLGFPHLSNESEACAGEQGRRGTRWKLEDRPQCQMAHTRARGKARSSENWVAVCIMTLGWGKRWTQHQVVCLVGVKAGEWGPC